MFYGVVLIGDRTNLCVPASWVFFIDVVKSQTYGLNCNKKKRIFFSKDLHKTPNFLLPLRNVFDPNEDACYMANIKKVFGSMDEGLANMEKRIGGLPPIYNESRYREQFQPVNEGENEINQEIERQRDIKAEVKTELDKVLAPLRNTITKFNKMMPSCDLTNEESDGIIDLTIDTDLGVNEEPCDGDGNFQENVVDESNHETNVCNYIYLKNNSPCLLLFGIIIVHLIFFFNMKESEVQTDIADTSVRARSTEKRAHGDQAQSDESLDPGEGTSAKALQIKHRANGEGTSAPSIEHQVSFSGTSFSNERNSILPVNLLNHWRENTIDVDILYI